MKKLAYTNCEQIKKEILRNTPEFLEQFKFSKSKFKSILESIEVMRNEIAHSQNSIISNLKWPEFVDTVMFIETFLKNSETVLENQAIAAQN